MGNAATFQTQNYQFYVPGNFNQIYMVAFVEFRYFVMSLQNI
jgi:hypothetical protein